MRDLNFSIDRGRVRSWHGTERVTAYTVSQALERDHFELGFVRCERIAASPRAMLRATARP